MTFFKTGLTLSALFLASTVAQASVVNIDFSGGMPANATQVSSSLISSQGYDFSSAPDPNLSVGFIGFKWGQNFGYGLTAPSLLGGNSVTASLTITRTDHQLFSLDSLTVFAGNILVGGPTDFQVTPFDANGNEAANPVVLLAGQFWTTIATGNQPLLANVSKLKISSGGLDHFTAFNFSSLAPTPVPLPAAAWFFLTALLGGMALARKNGRGAA